MNKLNYVRVGEVVFDRHECERQADVAYRYFRGLHKMIRPEPTITADRLDEYDYARAPGRGQKKAES